jgi:hypothetical protein
MKTRKFALLAALTAFASVSAGCATSKQAETEFGDAVRQVNRAQVYDANAAANPDPAAVLGGDPERLNNTLDGHRKDVAAPASVENPVTINIGN